MNDNQTPISVTTADLIQVQIYLAHYVALVNASPLKAAFPDPQDVLQLMTQFNDEIAKVKGVA